MVELRSPKPSVKGSSPFSPAKFKIKVISPKIPIERFFQPNNEEMIIKELIEFSNPNLEENTIINLKL